jgi:hypothetical protein
MKKEILMDLIKQMRKLELEGKGDEEIDASEAVEESKDNTLESALEEFDEMPEEEECEEEMEEPKKGVLRIAILGSKLNQPKKPVEKVVMKKVKMKKRGKK